MTETDLEAGETRVDLEWLDAAGVPVLRVTPADARTDATLLHFHGGGYRLGSPELFSDSIARIATAARTPVLSVDYRLSGESAFPAAMNDAVTSFEWATQHFAPDRIALWGDSAGGGLAAGLLLRIRQLGLPSPAAAFLFSPWADLRNTSRSYRENAASDELFSLTQATEAAKAYLAGHPAVDPLASPALGNWHGQPRLVVQVSDTEVLRDDALLLAHEAEAAGVEVRLKVHEAAPHLWHLAYPATPASERAITYMAEQLGASWGAVSR